MPCFHPLLDDAATGSANTWSRITVDEANGLVFLPTGSASPDYFGGLRTGNNGYANSIVALRAETGEVAWHFQTVHHDLWDYDVASPPLLYPANAGPAVAVGSKTGHLFLFNRVSGDPLFPIEERPVPKSDIREEAAAPIETDTGAIAWRVTLGDLREPLSITWVVANRRAQSRRPCRDRQRTRLHRRDDGRILPRVRHP